MSSAGDAPVSARFLVVLDVDSTLIEDEVIELVADYAGVTDEVARITERAMRGELDFEGSLRSRVALLRGIALADVDRVRERVTVTRGVPELVAGVHAAGGAIAVVSGGFHEVLDRSRPISSSISGARTASRSPTVCSRAASPARSSAARRSARRSSHGRVSSASR